MSSDPVANPSAPEYRGSRWRFFLILIVFLIGILIGRLLAPRCPPCVSSSTGAGGRVAGGATRGHGTPDGGSSSASKAGTPGGVVLQGEGVDAERGSGPGHDGKGAPEPDAEQGIAGDSADTAGGSADGSKRNTPTTNEALARTRGNGPDYQGPPDPPPVQVLTASDFRYDKTGLPRYAQSVTTIASTFSHPRGATGGYHSTCALVTSSQFGDVVDWYKTHLPAGWHAQVVGDVAALAQQVSIDNIMKMLTESTQSNGAPSSSAPPVASSANPLSVAMFSPPPNTLGEPSVMIRQKAGQSVEISLSKDGADQ